MPEFRVSFWAVDKDGPKWQGARPVMTKVEASRAEDVMLALEQRYEKIKKLKVNPGDYSVYDELVKVMAPKEIDHHESDLYVLRNEKSQPIVDSYVGSVTTFVSNCDRKVWYDLPFAYKPFWDKVSQRSAALVEGQTRRNKGPGKTAPRLTR